MACLHAPRVRQGALAARPLTVGTVPATEYSVDLGEGGERLVSARSADLGSAGNPGAKAGSASRHEASAVPQSRATELRGAAPSRVVPVSPTLLVPPSMGSESAKDGFHPSDSSLGAPNISAPSMGSGRAQVTPKACGPSPGASTGPDVELSWAIEIGSRYSSLSRELVRAGVPTLMLDHFTSQKGIAGPAIRLDLRSSKGWAPAYDLLSTGGLAYIHFEPPRGTLAPPGKLGSRAVAAKSKARVRTPNHPQRGALSQGGLGGEIDQRQHGVLPILRVCGRVSQTRSEDHHFGPSEIPFLEDPGIHCH